MKEKNNKFLHYAWIILFVCVVVNVALNSIFSMAGSIFLPYMMEDFGAGAGTIQLRMTVHSLVVIFMMPFVGKLYKKYNFKMLLILGICCYLGAFVAFSFCGNVYQYIALGLLQGVGSALALFIPGTYMINAWFKKKNGFAFAIFSFMISFVAVFTTPLVQKMVTANGWRYTYRFWAIICMAVAVPVVFFLCVATPQEKGLLPYGDEGDGTQEQKNGRTLRVKGVEAAVAKKHIAFWMFFILAMIFQAYASINRYLSPICVSHGLSAEQAAYCVSAYSLGTSMGGIIMGIVFDRLGVKLSTFLFGAVDITAMFLLLLGGDNRMVLSAACFLLAFAGMNYTINMGTKEVFGMLDYADIFATITIGKNIALLLCPVLFGYIYDWTGSYNLIFIISIMLILIGMLAAEIIYRTKKTLIIKEME